MNAPEKIYIEPHPFREDAFEDEWYEKRYTKESIEYIRKDIVDDMLKTAEDHAYFAGSEAMREGKQEEDDCWLFTVKNDNSQIFNCFFDFFPTKKDLQKGCEAEVYAILNVTRLTKTQYNKLLGKEE